MINGKPERLRLSRRKGYRKPEGAIVVQRGTPWGNPFRVSPTMTAEVAVAMFRMKTCTPEFKARVRAELAGHDLLCWCAPDQPCHADVLLEIAAS